MSRIKSEQAEPTNLTTYCFS